MKKRKYLLNYTSLAFVLILKAVWTHSIDIVSSVTGNLSLIFRINKWINWCVMKLAVMLVIVGLTLIQFVFGQENVRKPVVEFYIDGKLYKNGDELTVQKGQTLTIKAVQAGGRRDFVKFPDNFFGHNSGIEILSRGNNQLVYADQGVRSEWKLISENASYSSDNQITINLTTPKSNEAVLKVGLGNAARTFLKINLRTVWQFSSGKEQKTEINDSEAFLYLNISGANDRWFQSKNIHASGMSNPSVKEKLTDVQSTFDSIENCLLKIDYIKVQQEIRTLQSKLNLLHNTILQVSESNKAYKAEIRFIGLPSDQPVANLDVIAELQTQWTKINTYVSQQLYLFNTTEKLEKEKAQWLIKKYMDWQKFLPENWLIILATYLPEMNTDKVFIPLLLTSFAEEGNVSEVGNYQERLSAFYRQRSENIPIELQLISQVYSKLQPVKLFDGMLRSYLSSINWAKWENTREVGIVSEKQALSKNN